MGYLGVESSLTGRRWVGPSVEAERQAEAMEQATGLPVVDPTQAAVSMALGYITLNLSHTLQGGENA